jgi:hypothetical protein
MAVVINGDTGISPVTASGTSASVDGMTVGRGGGEVAQNTVVGANAGVANTTGKITAVGYLAARFNTTGSGNTALGGNDAAQDGALYLNTTGNYNIAVGTGSVASNTTGSSNTGIGYSALQNNTTASYNTALGVQSIYTNTTGERNTASGFQSLYANTTGVRNSAFGMYASIRNTTGNYNTSVGYEALSENTTASNNTAVGYQAGYSNTTGVQSAALGNASLYANTTGDNNTAIGHQSLDANTTGSNNTAVGVNALGAQTTASSNTAIGVGAGGTITTGTKNTILGRYDGNQGGLDIRTSSNQLVLSDGDGNIRMYFDANGKAYIGSTGAVNGSLLEVTYSAANQVAYFSNPLSSGTPYGIQIRYVNLSPNNTTGEFIYCNDSSVKRFTVVSNGGVYNYSANNVNLSDQREKKNIELAPNYLDKICQIPVKTFLFNDQTDTDLNLGAIAQDVQAVCPELVHESNWANKDEPEKMRLSIYQTDLQYALMKSIQELKTIVDAQAAEITALKAKVA